MIYEKAQDVLEHDRRDEQHACDPQPVHEGYRPVEQGDGRYGPAHLTDDIELDLEACENIRKSNPTMEKSWSDWSIGIASIPWGLLRS